MFNTFMKIEVGTHHSIEQLIIDAKKEGRISISNDFLSLTRFNLYWDKKPECRFFLCEKRQLLELVLVSDEEIKAKSDRLGSFFYQARKMGLTTCPPEISLQIARQWKRFNMQEELPLSISVEPPIIDAHGEYQTSIMIFPSIKKDCLTIDTTSAASDSCCYHGEKWLFVRA